MLEIPIDDQRNRRASFAGRCQERSPAPLRLATKKVRMISELLIRVQDSIYRQPGLTADVLVNQERFALRLRDENIGTLLNPNLGLGNCRGRRWYRSCISAR
jgi:hypothetical protein